LFGRVAIIGLGLIGGSVGLALKHARVAQEVTGFDLGIGVSTQAQHLGAIDQAFTSLEDTVRGADLVFLATPVGAIRALFQELAPMLSPGTLVTDVASTKAQVVSWAEEFLPSHTSFLGGHPMAGKEQSGVEAADANLFQGRIYCLTPTPMTPPLTVEKMLCIVHTLGARVRMLDPHTHDQQVASISHLPFLASVALVQTVSDSPEWQASSHLAATGFRDMSRLAAGSPTMYRDICLTNHQAITSWLDRYIATLQNLRTQIEAQTPSIEETFVETQQERQQWYAHFQEREG
jgi:prephenate dehydrogenase